MSQKCNRVAAALLVLNQVKTKRCVWVREWISRREEDGAYENYCENCLRNSTYIWLRRLCHFRVISLSEISKLSDIPFILISLFWYSGKIIFQSAGNLSYCWINAKVSSAPLFCPHVLSRELKKSFRQSNRAESSNLPLRGFAFDCLHCSACENRDPLARVDSISQRALYSLLTLHRLAVW